MSDERSETDVLPPLEETETTEETRPKTLPLRRLTNEQLTELARDMLTNRSYLVWIQESQMLQNSFGLLIAMLAADVDPREWNRVGAFYAPSRSALPRGINGQPMFLECRMLHVNDVPRLWDKIIPMQKALGL